MIQSRFIKWRLWPAALLTGVFLISGVSLSSESTSQSVWDVISKPAKLTSRANQALMLSVSKSGSRLLAVGEGGIIRISDDDGKNWRQAKSVPTSVALTVVQFSSANVAWAAGHSGVVLKSTDAGETWINVLDGRRAAQIELDAAKQAAAGDEANRRLRDANRIVEDGPDKPFLSLLFRDDKNGMVVGAYGLAFSTSDGGATWTSMMGDIDNPRARHLYHVTTAGNKTLIAGEQGLVVLANASELTYRQLAVQYPGTFFGSLILNESRFLVFGLRGNAFISEDSGATWLQVELPHSVSLTAGAVLMDGSVALVDESGQLLMSNSAAKQFKPVENVKFNSATGLVQADDGSLIVTTLRGVVRITADQIQAGKAK